MTDPAPPARVAIEAAKNASTAQVLFRCARLFNELALSAIRRETGHAIRPAHTNLFPHIDLDGTRPTELARRLGISKQAVGPLVAELEGMGMLERVPDPDDGRARLVRFASGPDGTHGVLAGLRLLGQVEAELAAELGEDRMAELHGLLVALMALVERRMAKEESEG